jgi:hypothetical protein
MYSSTVTYINPTTLTHGKVIDFTSNNDIAKTDDIAKPDDIAKADDIAKTAYLTSIQKRHYAIFDHKYYKEVLPPLLVGDYQLDSNTMTDFNVNVLRMVLKKKGELSIHLPLELLPIETLIINCIEHYATTFNDFIDNFIYITIRCADKINYYKNSSTWHVDGFQGARLTRHSPEISYIWSNNNPTQFTLEEYELSTFDYTKYNIHNYFKNYSRMDNLFMCDPNKIYLIDPYMVHRAPTTDFTDKRIFVRINMLNIEIEDYTNTVNPMLPMHYPTRIDVRDNLLDFTN